ncbi:MAG: Gfo/Idh/MocA family protein [Phycisphaerae bacterium]|nr:Gfo/Idh/MocA family oxidoreductase [Tepidisphaeraceae bacterium]
MSQMIKVGIVGAGWPGKAHARGYVGSGGWRILAVADLIPARRKEMIDEFKIAREYAAFEELLADRELDAVSICLPNYLHAAATIAALKAGKHVVCERPPALSVGEAKRIDAASHKYGKQVLYGFQRRFGGNELAARQAIDKGYAGAAYHARASWTRTRAIPIGTGWYTDSEKSGGGALMDLGSAMLDLAWSLLGEPAPASVYCVTHRPLHHQGLLSDVPRFDVEEAAFAVARFEGGATLELSVSWALNQSPAQNGVVCRVHGDQGAVEVYTAKGSVMHRGFNAKGESKEIPLKLPKLTGHAAMMRHFRECVLGKARPACGPRQGVVLMQMLEAMYKSADSGKSVAIAGGPKMLPAATATAETE